MKEKKNNYHVKSLLYKTSQTRTKEVIHTHIGDEPWTPPSLSGTSPMWPLRLLITVVCVVNKNTLRKRNGQGISTWQVCLVSQVDSEETAFICYILYVVQYVNKTFKMCTLITKNNTPSQQ